MPTKAFVLALLAAVLFSSAAAIAQPPKAAVLPPDDFVPGKKRVADYLADGWETKSGEVSMGGIVIWLSKGKHMAFCLMDQSRSQGLYAKQCFESAF